MEVTTSGSYLWQIYRTYTDRMIMYFRTRWGMTILLLVLYTMRVSITGGNLHIRLPRHKLCIGDLYPKHASQVLNSSQGRH